MLAVLKQLVARVGAEVSPTPTLAVLEQATQPEKVVEQIERMIETIEQLSPPP